MFPFRKFNSSEQPRYFLQHPLEKTAYNCQPMQLGA